MNLRPVLALSVWLVAGTVQPTSAQLPLRHDPAAQACAAPAGAGVSGTPEGHAILATVKRVDARQGQVEFTTERGSFVLTTPVYYVSPSGHRAFRGWVSIPWCKPSGDALERVQAQLRAAKLTLRNAPLKQDSVEGKRCIFTGEPATELVLAGRTY